jgi:hypothetical protein
MSRVAAITLLLLAPIAFAVGLSHAPSGRKGPEVGAGTLSSPRPRDPPGLAPRPHRTPRRIPAELPLSADEIAEVDADLRRTPSGDESGRAWLGTRAPATAQEARSLMERAAAEFDPNRIDTAPLQLAIAASSLSRDELVALYREAPVGAAMDATKVALVRSLGSEGGSAFVAEVLARGVEPPDWFVSLLPSLALADGAIEAVLRTGGAKVVRQALLAGPRFDTLSSEAVDRLITVGEARLLGDGSDELSVAIFLALDRLASMSSLRKNQLQFWERLSTLLSRLRPSSRDAIAATLEASPEVVAWYPRAQPK